MNNVAFSNRFRSWQISLQLSAIFATLVILGGCRPRPPAPPEARPVTSMLVLSGEVKRHTMQDLYRRPWPRDAAGYNPFRAGLIRLANHELLYPGRHRDVVEFMRGECLLFLRSYGEAAEAFDRAAESPTEIRPVALERRAACLTFQRATTFSGNVDSLEDLLLALEDARKATDRLIQEFPDPPLNSLARLEAEAADVAHARFLTDYMAITDEGAPGAIKAWRDVIEKHAASYRVMAHRLALGRLYEELALNYLQAVPPESMAFDSERFLGFARNARAEFMTVASADGYPERPVGRGRLVAINSLIEQTLRAAE